MDILDRIEEDTAYIEGDNGLYTVSSSRLKGAREGDVLICLEDGSFVPDAAATRERRERIQRLHRLLLHPEREQK